MTRSSPAATYDDDFFAWTQEQAAALRAMPAGRIGTGVDIAHVAEEIEDLGKRDLREVVSYLTRLLEHLMKMEGLPASRDQAHWGSEAAHFQRSARAAYSPSMRRLLDVDTIWRESAKSADRFIKQGGSAASMRQAACSFNLDELLSPAFDIDAALIKIAVARVG